MEVWDARPAARQAVGGQLALMLVRATVCTGSVSERGRRQAVGSSCWLSATGSQRCALDLAQDCLWQLPGEFAGAL